jgi:Lar family restriction alleviation protein
MAEGMSHTAMTDSVSEELKACPFCGGSDVELRDPHMMFSRLAAVGCNACEIQGPLASKAEEAIAAWNTRLSPPVSGDMVERVARAGAPASWLKYDELKRDGLPIPNWLCDIVAATLGTARAALTTSPEQGWQPIETFNRAEGKALIFDPKWGVAEGLRDHTGRWGLATFNGQVIEAHPTKWRPLPEPPGDQQ